MNKNLLKYYIFQEIQKYENEMSYDEILDYTKNFKEIQFFKKNINFDIDKFGKSIDEIEYLAIDVVIFEYGFVCSIELLDEYYKCIVDMDDIEYYFNPNDEGSNILLNFSDFNLIKLMFEKEESCFNLNEVLNVFSKNTIEKFIKKNIKVRFKKKNGRIYEERLSDLNLNMQIEITN